MLDDSAGSLGPECTTFVILSFEGPDPYARAGGLGVRVSELSLSLAEAGYEVHLVFVGDPSLPSEEVREDGRLVLHRWCQWISAYHPEGVYAGEEGKWHDFTDSVPSFVLDRLAPGAFAAGRRLVILGEEWHTAEAMCRISDGLWASGQRDQRHMPRFAWLEAQRRPGGDVEAAAARLVAIEPQRLVDLEEMRVGADLDGAVAAVGDAEADRLPSRVQLDHAVLQDVFAGHHGEVYRMGS